MEYFEVAVDIDKAMQAIDFMKDYVSKPENKAELDKAEAFAKELIYGLLLTGVQEGIFQNGSLVLSRVREKIFMAFDAGYYQGKTVTKQ